MCTLNFKFKKLGYLLFCLLIISPTVIKSQTIQLEWTPNIQQDITSYRIYRSTNTKDNYAFVANVSHPISSYFDSTVVYDTRYYYAATSVDQQGKESAISNEVEIVTPKAYALSVNCSPFDAGNVAIDPQKALYAEGSQVTVTATPNSGYRFEYWSGDVSANELNKIITMDSNKVVVANFSGTAVSITGSIKYANSGIALSNTQVNLTGGQTNVDLADANGNYAFTSLASNANYAIFPQRDSCDCGTSILSYDAALAARIAMDLIPDATEVSKVAADANRDGEVQMYDASLIAMQAVGLAPRSGSHVGEFGFYPNNRTYSQLNSECNEQDFTAAILGDVDGNWQPMGPLLKENDANRTYSHFEDKVAAKGDKISFPFFVDEKKEILSFDIWLKYDYKSIKYVGLNKTEMLNNFQILENKLTLGSIRIGGFCLQAVTASGLLLDIMFEAIGRKGQASDIELVYFRINAEPEQQALAKVVIGEGKKFDLPDDYALYDNYPNPFNPETTIKYQIPEKGQVTLKIYNMIGQEVRMLINEEKNAGIYQVLWDGKNDNGQLLPNGMYFYRLVSDYFIAVKKMSLIK